jgi:hypothetical protein
MIDVQAVLRDTPHFETFCSVEKLHRQVESLRGDPRFDVADVGASVNGVPIHHVRCGKGSIRALFVGFQHCMEPMNGLTIFSLIELLKRDHPALVNQGIEWHFVPCIDPDGAMLNEGWSQKPFTFPNYMRHFHQQPYADQVDCSFPFKTRTRTWDKPSQEARVLMGVLDQICPDFFYTGHDARVMNGSWHFVDRVLDPHYCRQLSSLLQELRIPVVVSSSLARSRRLSESVYLSQSLSPMKIPEAAPRSELPPGSNLLEYCGVTFGVTSFDYLKRLKPEAVIFTSELTNIRYLGNDLMEPFDQSRRKTRLRVSVENKLIAAAVLDKWEGVKADLNIASPFYRKMHVELIELIAELPYGLPYWYEGHVPQLLSDPFYAAYGTRGEWLDAMIGVSGRFGFLCQAYEFVRLLKVSRHTPAVREAIEDLETVFDAALAEIDAAVDFRSFEPVDCTTLARAHAGSALIVLNSLLEVDAAKSAQGKLHRSRSSFAREPGCVS